MKKKFDCFGMSCAVCAKHVDDAVRSVNGVKDCNVNLVSNSFNVEIEEDNDEIIDAIINSVRKAGYDAKIVNDNKISVKDKIKEENKKIKFRIIFSFCLLIPLMYLSMANMIGLPMLEYLLDVNNSFIYGSILFLLTVPILFVNRIYFIKGYKNLFTNKSNMDSLIALGSTASFLYATISFIIAGIAISKGNVEQANFYRNNLYFDSSAMILTLVTLGKYLESIAKGKTTTSIDDMIRLLPENANLLDEDGNEKIIKLDEIKVGDLLVVKAGERVPVDGEVIKGNASIDSSSITGESIPYEVDIGSNVSSSMLNINGYIVIRANCVGKDSSMQKLIDLVEEASNSKAPISRLADKVSRIFVPIVLSISLLSFISWAIISHNFELAFRFGISVLVISCPCALGLATPVAIMVSVGKAAKLGIIYKKAESIEIASKINTIVLDKTGTITKGKPVVQEIFSYNFEKTELLGIAYALENGSTHPLSNAIINYCADYKKEAINLEFMIGKGVKGEVDGKVYYCGNIKYIESIVDINENIRNKYNDISSLGATPLIFSNSERVIGLISVADEIKESSVYAINELKKMGIKVVMATGDNELVAKNIATLTNIEEVRANILPTDKSDIVNELKQKGATVAFIGDGVNDSLALVNSDLGIAIGAGSDIAVDHADAILIKSDLVDATNLIKLAKTTLKVMKINLMWAFLYNIIAIPIALGAFYNFGITINPMISSIAMSCSSLFVVLNALTINMFKETKNKNIENIIKENNKMKKVVVKVDGMMCMHCEKRVKDAISKIDNVKDVNINLETKEVAIDYEDNLDLEVVKKVVTDAGYNYLG